MNPSKPYDNYHNEEKCSSSQDTIKFKVPERKMNLDFEGEESSKTETPETAPRCSTSPVVVFLGKPKYELNKQRLLNNYCEPKRPCLYRQQSINQKSGTDSYHQETYKKQQFTRKKGKEMKPLNRDSFKPGVRNETYPKHGIQESWKQNLPDQYMSKSGKYHGLKIDDRQRSNLLKCERYESVDNCGPHSCDCAGNRSKDVSWSKSSSDTIHSDISVSSMLIHPDKKNTSIDDRPSENQNQPSTSTNHSGIGSPIRKRLSVEYDPNIPVVFKIRTVKNLRVKTYNYNGNN